MTLHYESGGEIEVNRITIVLPGGECEEPVSGMATCVATTLSEGTATMSGEEIANTLEFNGAWLSPAVSTHYTTLSLSSINDNFSRVLPVFLDIIFNPSFPEQPCRMKLEQAAAMLDLKHEKVTFLADEAIRPLAYGADNPLSRPQSAEVIKALTPGDLSDFHYSRLYSPDIHIYFSGRISDEMIESVKTALEEITTQGLKRYTSLTFPTSYNEPKSKHVCRKDALQSAIKMMIPAPGRTNSDYIALRAAVVALGGYFGSRLMMNIREEKGLTYGISSALIGYKERSFITISTQTDSNSVDEVIRLIRQEIEKMKDSRTYTEDEINRLSRLSMTNLANILDTPFSRMEFYQTELLADTPPNYFDEQEKFARNITAEKLAEIATKYFDLDSILLSVAGS